MAKVKEQTPEQKIVAHLEDNGQMLSWLANKIGISAGHLHSVLKGEGETKRSLTELSRQKINEVLNTDY